jgi:hypothetical protein
VLTHSPTLHDAQARGLDQTLAKACARLAELQARLHQGNTRRPRNKVEAEIATILKPRWVGEIITATLSGDEPATFRLTWRTNHHARAKTRSEPPWIFRRENQLRSFLFWKERGNGDGEAAQVIYA